MIKSWMLWIEISIEYYVWNSSQWNKKCERNFLQLFVWQGKQRVFASSKPNIKIVVKVCKLYNLQTNNYRVTNLVGTIFVSNNFQISMCIAINQLDFFSLSPLKIKRRQTFASLCFVNSPIETGVSLISMRLEI